MQLTAGELTGILSGQLRLGEMPPLAGDLELIQRICVPHYTVEPGDVVFLGRGLQPTSESERLQAHEAFAHGALGIVSSFPIEPWAGRFSIQVPHAGAALWELAAWNRQQLCGKTIVIIGNALPAQMVHQAIKGLGLSAELYECHHPVETTVPLALAKTDPQKTVVLSWNCHECESNMQLISLCRCDSVLLHTPNQESEKKLTHDDILTLAQQTNVVISLPQSTTHVFDSTLRANVTTAGPSNHFDVYPSAVNEQPNGIRMLVGSQPFHLRNQQLTSVDDAVAAIAILRSLGFDLQQISSSWDKASQ